MLVKSWPRSVASSLCLFDRRKSANQTTILLPPPDSEKQPRLDSNGPPQNMTRRLATAGPALAGHILKRPSIGARYEGARACRSVRIAQRQRTQISRSARDLRQQSLRGRYERSLRTSASTSNVNTPSFMRSVGRAHRGKRMRSETISIHGGFSCDPVTKAVAPPIYQNVAYEFESADEAAALFNLEVSGYRYSRISNPTTDILEKRVAQLEGGAAALAVASVQAALAYAFLTLADRGGSIVAPPQLYGTTHTLLAHTLRRHGVEARFAASDRAVDIEPLIDDSTRAVFCESIGNPAGNVCDIEKLAQLAHSRGLPLIVDNTVATPVLLRPIEYGADIVVHSLTKFMGGHGAAMGGAIVDAGRFDWASQARRFPMFCEPDESYHGLVYVDRFGREAFVARARSVYQRTACAVLAPMSAFLILLGIETVAVRMERHVENARAVARFLRGDPRIEWVDYVGFPDHPHHTLALKYLRGRAPSLLTLGV